MRVVRSTSSCTCAGAVCRRELSIACRLIPGRTVCPALIAALPCLECSGEWHRSTCAGHFRFLVSSRCKPGLRESSTDSVYERPFSPVGLRVCVSGRQAVVGAMELPAAAGPARLEAEFHSRLPLFSDRTKNTPGFLFPGVFFIRGCEKLSWYRCSWSQAGCCRHR